MSDQAILLLSGGMDSTTLLFQLRRDQPALQLHTISIDYGQRHRVELDCAARLSDQADAVSHRVLPLDLSAIGGSPLTDVRLQVPAAADDAQIATVVPFRNMLFVTMAAACSETMGIHDIYLSPVRDDFAAYRDCRRPFYDSLETALGLGATRDTPFHIHTPFVELTKTQILRQGLELGVPYDMTHTCYEGTRPACGVCDACAERRDAFAACGATDPLPYR